MGHAEHVDALFADPREAQRSLATAPRINPPRRSTPMAVCYKITDPDTVRAYTEAEESYARWRADSAAFVSSLPGVCGFTRRSFSGEHSGLILKLDSGAEPGGLPGGWRYVKTRGTVEPKLHKAGEYAWELYAPFQDTPHQPAVALKEAGVAMFVFDSVRSGIYTAGHFHHDGVVYVKYGQAPEGKELSPLLVLIKESEWHLAAEAKEAGK